jgi:restriction system protein
MNFEALTYMAIPDYQALMLPVLKAASRGEIRMGDAIEQIAVELNLSEEDRSQLLPSGSQPTFSNRVAWARSYLGKAGLLDATRRGWFTISDRGRQLLDTNPSSVDNKVLNQYEEFRKFRDRSTEIVDSGAIKKTAQVMESTAQLMESRDTPDDTLRNAQNQIEATLQQDLLERVRAASPAFFEHLVVRLLLAMGFGASTADAGRILGRTGDDGVDGVIDQDALGLDRIYIQAKRYAENSNVGPGAIRDFFGSLDKHKAAKGLFITTSAFTKSAEETAASLSKRIVLLNGIQLAALMTRHNVGCRIEDTLYIKRIDENFFEQ